MYLQNVVSTAYTSTKLKTTVTERKLLLNLTVQRTSSLNCVVIQPDEIYKTKLQIWNFTTSNHKQLRKINFTQFQCINYIYSKWMNKGHKFNQILHSLCRIWQSNTSVNFRRHYLCKQHKQNISLSHQFKSTMSFLEFILSPEKCTDGFQAQN